MAQIVIFGAGIGVARGLATAAALVLAGCAGSVVVDHAIEADVTVRDAAGRAVPGHVAPVAKHANMAYSFDFLEYRDDTLVWTFWGSADVIVNRAAAIQCLHFEEARVTSNFHEAPVALAVYSWAVLRRDRGASTLLPKKPTREPSYFTPPVLCLDPGEQVTLLYGSDLRELFPNHRMFNMSRPGEDLAIADKGIGNWIAMRLPVTLGGQPRTMDIKLTALDSKARICHY